ncbi:MAG: hypothetical protein ACLTSZ_08610 [Lachnospiraceae bacterium]
MCLIPYHSIGKSGWMKAVIADRMETVYGKDRRDRASGARSQCSDT